MVLNAFLSGDNNTKIAEARILYLTKKTVRFGDDIYQFRNVTGFGIGKVKPKKISMKVILILFFLGPFVGLIPGLTFLGLIMLLLAIAAIFSNIVQPQLYGLQLYVNSGDAQIFITSDTDWLKRAVGKLYDFMENSEEGSHMTIQVGGEVSGTIIQGSTARDVKNMVLEEDDAVINTSEKYRLEHHQD
ncbi:MAG: hypothetical protein Fur006_34230 [Coleofasciculaceae cyanobacterium]